MKILPQQTNPPASPFERRHRPKVVGGPRGYLKYRPCLRWDFGFTCPFCLLHEVDFVRGGCAEGSGITWIEHVVPQSKDHEQRNDYKNCVYCCAFCNHARSDRPIESDRGRLLNPTHHTWANHFEVKGDCLKPKPGDGDALYTHECYDIDDLRKTTLRRCRRTLIADHWELLTKGPTSLAKLVQLAEQNQNDPTVVKDLLACAQLLRRSLFRAIDDLQDYCSVPRDADKKCRCGTTEQHSLPPELEKQTWELPSHIPGVDD